MSDTMIMGRPVFDLLEILDSRPNGLCRVWRKLGPKRATENCHARSWDIVAFLMEENKPPV
jgi:hypothetical protein